MDMSAKAILNQLNSEQQKAVLATEGPVLVLAGAGSGKTRTLTARVAYLILEKGVAPHHILAVTFTNKAAGEMKERIGKMLGPIQFRSVWEAGYGTDEPRIGTFHSVCARILRETGEALGFTPHFTIYDSDDQVKAVKTVMKELLLSEKEHNPKKLLAIIEHAKREMVSPQELREKYQGTLEQPILSVVLRVYRRYQEYLLENNAMDFGDLLYNVVFLFKQYTDVLNRYQNQWQYVLVDEYQDTNPVQYEFCRLLADRHNNLFVVGDDYQSIYRFRGADISNILSFNRDYPSTATVLLEQNYRSTKNILNVAQVIIKKNISQHEKKLWTKNAAGALPTIAEVESEQGEAEFVLQEVSKHGGVNGRSDAADDEAVAYDYDDSQLDENDMPKGILDRVIQRERQLRRSNGLYRGRSPLFSGVDVSGVNLNDFVVLYRTNSQSRALEEVLLTWGVPYRIIGGIKFYERREIKDILAYIRVLGNPQDMVSLQRIINVPPRGIGPKTFALFIEAMRRTGGDALDAARALASQPSHDMAYKRLVPFCLFLTRMADDMHARSVADSIETVAERSGYLSFLKQNEDNYEERHENIKELKTVAQRLGNMTGIDGVRIFLEEVALVSDIDRMDGSMSALTLMTAHSAKGLEFPHVFMVGMEQGLFPHASSLMDAEEYEEERRLCYVGVTRAKESLYFVHARKRTLYGVTLFPQPSEFIADLNDSFVRRIAL